MSVHARDAAAPNGAKTQIQSVSWALWLLFFVAEDVDETIRANVRDFVLDLAGRRQWLNGPPRFVYTRNEGVDAAPDDPVIETVGGYLETCSGPLPANLPRELGLRHLEDRTVVVC